MTLSRRGAVWTHAVVTLVGLALIAVVVVVDRGRADWVGGPFLLFVYAGALVLQLAVFAAVASERARLRLAGVDVGAAVLTAQLWLLGGYLGAWAA